ncbi:hypothetical protein HWD97_15325 [Ochrobactrum sp. C6C9]|uniref:hypothetical protein n=1 Tax=Ochrobactrum sp. C6C9 TaxID=2736662 RepID=UPI0035304410|nr:hypothetical protein [Ochrobactrum sp. C6C9]
MHHKTVGSYYAFSDIGQYSDQFARVQWYQASWIVPSVPTQSQNKSELRLGIELRAYDSMTMLAPTLTWDPDSGSWFISCLYDDEGNGQISEGNRAVVQPGELLLAGIVLTSTRPYIYDVFFLGTKHTAIKSTITLDHAVNQMIVKFDPSTRNYADLPPDENVEIKNIGVILADTGGIPDPNLTFNWQFSADGFITPSGKNGIIVDDGIFSAEIDFYFN